MFSKILSRFLTKIEKKQFSLTPICHWNIPKRAEIDTEYLLSPQNIEEIEANISRRKGIGDIKLVHELNRKLNENVDSEVVKDQLYLELFRIPNKTHPMVSSYSDEGRIVRTVGTQKQFEGKEFQEIVKRLKLARSEQLGNFSGSKSYYFLGELAELEQSIIRFVVSNLLKNGFELVSVPDILPRDVVEGCGMNTRGSRTQVYSLDENLHGPDLCLSGTSEIALAGLLSNQTLCEKDLPLRLAAISRCYRAETSNLQQERGIYRVHEFTKVEMFAVTVPEQSEEFLEDIRRIEEECFGSLGLHFKVIDMPPHELGAQAYRKYDMEAWLCGRRIYGEISSCSNCLDYQSRRLGIKYKRLDGGEGYVHTLNGTACAIPRLLIALIEQGQSPKGFIEVPEVLRKYMGGKDVIGRQNKVPELKLIKNMKN